MFFLFSTHLDGQFSVRTVRRGQSLQEVGQHFLYGASITTRTIEEVLKASQQLFLLLLFLKTQVKSESGIEFKKTVFARSCLADMK